MPSNHETYSASNLCRGCGYPTTHCGCDTTEIVLVEPNRAAAAIRSYLRETPELRKDAYRNDHTDADALLGLCYPAAEAYYHLRDCEPEIYCLSWSDVDPDAEGTHWYLREADGERRWIDISLPIRPITMPPFEAGTHRGFLTGDTPSKRAQQVLDAVRPRLDVAGGGDR